MSDFFTRLLGATRGAALPLRPRLPGAFAPLPGLPSLREQGSEAEVSAALPDRAFAPPSAADHPASALRGPSTRLAPTAPVELRLSDHPAAQPAEGMTMEITSIKQTGRPSRAVSRPVESAPGAPIDIREPVRERATEVEVSAAPLRNTSYPSHLDRQIPVPEAAQGQERATNPEKTGTHAQTQDRTPRSSSAVDRPARSQSEASPRLARSRALEQVILRSSRPESLAGPAETTPLRKDPARLALGLEQGLDDEDGNSNGNGNPIPARPRTDVERIQGVRSARDESQIDRVGGRKGEDLAVEGHRPPLRSLAAKNVRAAQALAPQLAADRTVPAQTEGSLGLVSARPEQRIPAHRPEVTQAPLSAQPIPSELRIPARQPGAAQATASARATQVEPSTVRVSIGRIEVRVMPPPAASPPQRRAVRPAPEMSLSAYLERREGGAR